MPGEFRTEVTEITVDGFDYYSVKTDRLFTYGSYVRRPLFSFLHDKYSSFSGTAVGEYKIGSPSERYGFYGDSDPFVFSGKLGKIIPGFDPTLTKTDYIRRESDTRSRQKILLPVPSESINSSDNDSIGDSDEDLSTVLDALTGRTLIVGVGGAGNNMISAFREVAADCDITTVAINTDAQELFYSGADVKILIGKNITAGSGTGGSPELGKKCMQKDIRRFEKLLKNDGLMFLLVGLGGGTGTGAAPILAEKAVEYGYTVISICTLPFGAEGFGRKFNSVKGLANLVRYSTVIPIRNNDLLKVNRDTPFVNTFRKTDIEVAEALEGVISSLLKCGLINLSYRDVKSLLSVKRDTSGFIYRININSTDIRKIRNGSDFGKAIGQIIGRSITDPIKIGNPSDILSCIISIRAGIDITMGEINGVISTISSVISPSAELKFAAYIDPGRNNIDVTLIGRKKIDIDVYMAVHTEEMTPEKTVLKFVL